MINTVTFNITGKIFATPPTDKELLSSIYQQFKKQTTKNTTNAGCGKGEHLYTVGGDVS